MDKNDAIRKVKACLELARRGEPGEAAVALRQAQALMRQYGLEHPDIVAGDVREEVVRSGASSRPAVYEAGLAGLVSRAYGCDLFYARRWDERKWAYTGQWVFVGIPPGVEVAAYSLEVLLRQLRKVRGEYIKRNLKRFKPANKTIRADAFCDGWVHTVAAMIPAQPVSEEQAQAISVYMRREHGEMGRLTTTRRDAGRTNVEADFHVGRFAGREADLHSGIESRPAQKQIGFGS